MLSERVQRQVDRLLDEADEAIRRLAWATVRDRANAVLALDRQNADALAYLSAAQEQLESAERASPGATLITAPLAAPAHPASFCDGRYEVQRFLGEGGKKRVYLAHDTKLGRFEDALGTLGGAARMVQLAGTTVRAGRRSLCLSGMGRRDEAREDFRQVWERLHVSDEEDEMFSAILADLLASAVVLDERDALRVLIRRLQGITVVAVAHSVTVVARWLGEANALLGDRAQARADYERALAWATTVHHRPEIALTRLGLAELLLDDLLAISGQLSAMGELRESWWLTS